MDKRISLVVTTTHRSIKVNHKYIFRNNWINQNRIMKLIITCLLLSFTEGLTTFNNEFNSNIFDDDFEYSLMDNSDEILDDGLEHFFRQVRSLEEDYKNVETVDTREYYRKLPRSEFIRRLREMDEVYQNNPDNFEEMDNDVDFTQSRRYKRSAQNDIQESKEKKDLQDIVDNGEKPLEIVELNLSNVTENGLEEKALKINDFIRFKRDIHDENATKMVEDDKSRLKRERDDVEGKRDIGIKQQWIKQPYPIAGGSERRLDDSPRTPRVNFITQRRSESAPFPVYYNYEPNYRYRDFPDSYEKGYYSRTPRHYQQHPDPYHWNYYRDDNPRYPYDNHGDNGNYYNDRPVYRQRRIIYYATLPEVVRSPSTSDSGDRYNYPASYEPNDSYSRIPSQSVQRVPDPYRFRKPFPLEKSRYDESGPIPLKGSYPLKVQTDVNVKEIKKNPERRIFSEGDHRYNHGSYQPETDRY
ncbi:hypothetical protein Trydic_g10729 [Trypoxylus dichotomus]